MTLIAQLAARKAAFHFVERGEIAYNGSRELVASVAKWLEPSHGLGGLPDVLPFWMGSYLPFSRARERWAFPVVWTVVVGVRDAATRRALVAHLRRNPPLGMFDVDADADRHNLPLVHSGYVVPNAAIRLAERGRSFDREYALDVIGPADDEESWTLEMAARWEAEGDDDDMLGPALLRLLASRVGRKLPAVQASHGFEALVDHASELYSSGVVGAAGAVAGVAFERLMRDALIEVAGHGAAAPGVPLGRVIDQLGRVRGWDTRRLHAYRTLRNDLAHRLGDEAAAPRDPDELYDMVARLLRWLDRQGVSDSGQVTLQALEPDPVLSHQELFDEARAAADEAATAARVTLMSVAGAEFEPEGFAWVRVRDAHRQFTQWLVESGNAEPGVGGARISAPSRSLERNLAWAYAFALRLREAGYAADYAGVPN